MRLDHLLSKEEEVDVGYTVQLSKLQTGTMLKSNSLCKKISGGDALRGHTRSHPEHDG